jgi:hypothetical protein
MSYAVLFFRVRLPGIVAPNSHSRSAPIAR